METYESLKVQSTPENETTSDLKALATYIENGHIVLWQHHGIFLIQVENEAIASPLVWEQDMQRHMVRVRAFNAEKEWHVWRTKQGFAGRKRADSLVQEGDTEAVDGEMKLRGVIVDQLGNRRETQTWRLKTRSYIGYNRYQHAGYVDSRFLEITLK